MFEQKYILKYIFITFPYLINLVVRSQTQGCKIHECSEKFRKIFRLITKEILKFCFNENKTIFH